MLDSSHLASAGLRIEVEGLVQGVGFRPWIHQLAYAAGIRGRVWNHPGGVTIEAFGEQPSLDAFVEQLEHPPMPAARVRDLRLEPMPCEPPTGFEIVASRGGEIRRPAIPPDLALCTECRRELFDPSDRRYRYPFVNCTRCGPRYTISTDVPYDRASTTMSGFAMCADCEREYHDPNDRRFHAQPNACPVCGPRLELIDTAGHVLAGDPVSGAADALRDGRIVAIKGLGGYHLACAATSDAAVARLRERKRRDEKPFAVMCADLDAAARLAWLSDTERQLLGEASRPIVLVERRPEGDLADAVAPGNPLVGIMLPYTPLHELVLTAVGIPLVMTSGNVSDEPMAVADGEALRLLAGLADLLLRHDREIANRCDDSVARVVSRRTLVLRRGRGFVPVSLRVPRRVPRPLLACGAHLKNTFCLAEGDFAWLGPHVGDLATAEACASYESSVTRFQRFVGIEPEVLAHDLHPDYFTTTYAADRARASMPGLERIAVQHHHAHVASAMAEHGIDEPVIGVAWDGTGYGLDGTAWGGEILIARYAGFERFATFRPIRLAGGDRAIREVWRIALALVDDAFDGDPPLDRIEVLSRVEDTRIAAVRRQIATQLNAPLAHGIGRYFDAVGALLLARPESRFEGQVAALLSFAADEAEHRPYPFEIDAAAAAPSPVHPRIVIDLRPMVREVVGELLAKRSVATIAARFQATLVAAGAEAVRLAQHHAGRLPVVLTGGCFQNAQLADGLSRALRPACDVLVHGEVPPNDGGLALGQAMVAAARLGAQPTTEV